MLCGDWRFCGVSIKSISFYEIYKLFNVVLGQYFGPVIVLPVNIRNFFHYGEWKKLKLIYADDPTLMVVVPSPSVKVIVEVSLNRDLGKISEWCDL